MINIGIDPGLKGGIAIIEDGVLTVQKMPTMGADTEYDIYAMKNLLLPYRGRNDVLMSFERQHAMPGQGLTSSLKTGTGYGILMGLAMGMDIPHKIWPASVWQKALFVGLSAKLDTKVKSEMVAKRLFPSADFRRTERSKKGHDGLYDATCLAYYGSLNKI